VITKRDDTAYQHDTRVLMKIKHVRTVDFVVAGTACKSTAAGAIGSAALWRADGSGPRSPSAAPRPRVRLVQLGDQFAPASHRCAEHRPTRARSCRPSTATPARRCRHYRGELRAAWTVCDRAALFYKQTGPSKERTALLTHRWARRVITRHS
jgi:hypothetical protein